MIFQENKWPLKVLFLICTASNGIYSMELSKKLKVNSKTGCLLQTKTCIPMKRFEFKEIIEFDFYESDVAYIGTISHNGKQGLGSDKQPFLIVLATV